MLVHEHTEHKSVMQTEVNFTETDMPTSAEAKAQRSQCLTKCKNIPKETKVL